MGLVLLTLTVLLQLPHQQEGSFILPDKKKIHWHEHSNLNWNDFKAKPEQSSPFMAASMCSIGYSSVYEGDQLSVTVNCTFDPSRSWVKQEHKNDVLLNHEQQHFNLAEIYARLLRKKISEHTFSPDNFQKKLRKLFDDNYQAYREKQVAYDEETNHGRIEDAQKKWDQKISEKLAELDSFQMAE